MRSGLARAARTAAFAAVLVVLPAGVPGLAGPAGLSGPARAQPAPVPMPQDTRLVVFRYDANASYLILTRPGAVTHLELEPDESVVALALGDTVQWIVQDKGPHLFVKPIRADLYTSATLVTSRRTYQLALRSSPEGGAWYQRVSWSHPELIAIARDVEAARVKAEAEARQKLAAQTVERGVPLERLNFAYRIDGQAPFRPQQVIDDGRFTYIRLPAALQELPALFVLGEAGEGELVNYTLRGDFLVVQRLAERFVLRLGRAEVTIARTAGDGRSGAGRDPFPAELQ